MAASRLRAAAAGRRGAAGANSFSWTGSAWACDGERGRAANETFDADGFVVLSGLLPPSAVDTMADSVNRYIAQGGPLVSAGPKAWPGLLILGLNREPALAHCFEWLHGSRKLHAALAQLYHWDGYRYVSRNEVTIDRGVPWHQDGVPFTPLLGHTPWIPAGREAKALGPGTPNLLNVGMYLQDHTNQRGGLEVIPGATHAPTAH